MKDIIIIGAGPTGLYMRKMCINYNFKGILLEKSNKIGGQINEFYPSKLIYNIPGIKKIKGKILINNLKFYKNDYNKFKIKLNFDIKKIKRNNDHYLIYNKNNKILKTKIIILAIGNEKVILNKFPLANKDIKNISYKIENIFLFKNKNVTILGGGNSAIDLANKLIENKITKNITIINRSNNYYKAIPKNVARMQKQQIVKEYLNYNIVGIVKRKNKINTLILKHNQNNKILKIDVENIIVKYGIKIIENKAINELLIKNENGKIIVNNFFETKLKNIYAIGNCCWYEGKSNNLVTNFGETANLINILYLYFKQQN